MVCLEDIHLLKGGKKVFFGGNPIFAVPMIILFLTKTLQFEHQATKQYSQGFL